MSFRLGPDGKPIEIESSFDSDAKQTEVKKGGTKPPQQDTNPVGGDTMPPNFNSSEPKTQPPKVDLFDHIDNKASGDNMRPDAMSNPLEPETIPPNKQSAGSGQEQGSPVHPPEELKTQLNMDSADVTEEYVCGWLVVVDGPGASKGTCVSIGPGQSAISRSPNERITLSADTSITSKQQLLVIYDDQNREFIIAPGNGKSLNRLNGQVIAGQTVISAGDILQVGNTKLRFVPFCDQNFNWD